MFLSVLGCEPVDQRFMVVVAIAIYFMLTERNCVGTGENLRLEVRPRILKQPDNWTPVHE